MMNLYKDVKIGGEGLENSGICSSLVAFEKTWYIYEKFSKNCHKLYTNMILEKNEKD